MPVATPPPLDPLEIEELRLARGKRLRLFAALGGLSLALFLVGIFAWPRIDRRIEERNLAKAERLLAERRFRDAWLLFEQTVQANPASLEARRARAHFYQASAHPDALAEWRRLALASKAEEDFVAWADFARLRSEWDEVEAAITAWPRPAREEAALHRARLALAWAREDREALRELAASPSLDRAEAVYFGALARLGGPEDGAAREDLVRLFQDGAWRLRAALTLLGRALASPEAARQPQQARLEVARAILGPEGDWPGLCRLLEESAPANAADAVAWARALRGVGENEAAAAWLARHAAAWPADPTLAAERADLAVALARWSELQSLLVQGAWGPLPPAAVELALAARLQNARGKARNALLTWGDALAETERVPGAARALARLAAFCAWPEAYEQALLVAVEVLPTDAEAWRALVTTAEALGDAPKHAQLLERWLRAGAENPEVIAEAAYVHLLAGGAWNDLWRERTARLESPVSDSLRLWLGEALGAEQIDALARQADRLSPRGRLLLALALTRRDRTDLAGPLWLELSRYRFLPAEETLRARARS